VAPLLVGDFAEAAAVAEDVGLMLGVEHNAVGHRLLVDVSEVEALLDAVPALGLVWDVNHTAAEDVERFLALRERLTLVHVSDTPLPETNHHLPLGRGSVDLTALRAVPGDVPLILEIGGLPHSGGPGLDTDDALLESRRVLEAALADEGDGPGSRPAFGR
jgi:sugar phosphate isomerase/epimerase